MRGGARRKSKGARGAIWVSSRNQTLRRRETQGEHEFARHFWLRARRFCYASCSPETFYAKVLLFPLLNEAKHGTMFCHSATSELLGPV